MDNSVFRCKVNKFAVKNKILQKTVKNLPLYCWILSDLAIIFLMSVYLLIHSFFVQNYLTQKLTNLLSDKFNIFSTIGNVEFSSLNSLKIKAFYLEDDRKDTLFYTDEFSLKIDLPKLLFQQKIYIKNIEVMGLKFYLKNQPEEKKLNLQFLIQQIQQKTAPSTAISTTKNKENMAIFLENFQLKNSRFIFKDHFLNTLNNNF